MKSPFNLIISLCFSSIFAIGDSSNVITKLPPLKADASESEVRLYETNLQTLVGNSKFLKSASLWDLKMILYSLSGALTRNTTTLEEWHSIRNSETQLIGLVINVERVQIDPSVDTNRLLPLSYPTYDETHPNPSDRQNADERLKYNEALAAKKMVDQQVARQSEIRRYLTSCIRIGNHYLHLLYPDQKSVDPDEIANLRHTGLDQDTIDLLTKQ